MLTNEQLTELANNVDFLKYLEKVPDDSGSLFSRIVTRNQALTDFFALQLYVVLKDNLESYHELESIEPMWTPEVDADENFSLSFRVKAIVSQYYPFDQFEVYGYGECPSCIEDRSEKFAQLIEVGEYISPDYWNDFKEYGFNKKFKSIDDLQSIMCDGLLEFSTEVERWYLHHQNEHLPAAKKKSGLRL